MKPIIDIYLIRHTKPLIAAGVCYGQLDCPVGDDYQQQFAKVSRYFKDKRVNAVYSSPLQRCAKLAEDLAKSHINQPVIYNDAFKEINFGDWEGEKWDDIARVQIDAWNKNRLHFQFPNGETPAQFHERVFQAWTEFVASLPAVSQNIIIVAHSGVICSLLCRQRDIPLEKMTELKVGYASISKITV